MEIRAVVVSAQRQVLVNHHRQAHQVVHLESRQAKAQHLRLEEELRAMVSARHLESLANQLHRLLVARVLDQDSRRDHRLL